MKTKAIYGFMTMITLFAAVSASGIAFRRSFKNGYPSKLNVSKEEANDTFRIGNGVAVQSDGRGGGTAVRTVAEIAGTVVDVADGATFGLELPGGGVTRIRLKGITVPDVARPTGQKCKEHLETLLLNKKVRVTWRQKDRNGCILGTVFLDAFGEEPQDIGRQMLEDGFAQAGSGYDPRYTAVQSKARTERRGLWGKAK